MSDIPPDPPAYPVFPTQPTTVILPSPSDLQPIYTERLILRPLQLTPESALTSDAASLFHFRSRPEVATWLLSKAPHTSIEETKAWMRSRIYTTPDAAGAVHCRHFSFAVVARSDPETVIGGVSVNSLHPAPSVGYALHPDFWGMGFATEAVRGIVGAWWGLPRVEVDDGSGLGDGEGERLFAATNCENLGSLKVLQKAGFEVYEYVECGDRLAFMSIRRREDLRQ
ncbi:GNAT domain-containing protein [Aspergillus varians]